MAGIDIIGDDRSMALIRASVIPDAAALADALVAGGIRAIEFTFTTPTSKGTSSAPRPGRRAR
jgi:2-dehydro-3-deoxyphosphogluconate aldolase/(4S)-4-hydroxy-2-oxoglutarate aldolase